MTYNFITCKLAFTAHPLNHLDLNSLHLQWIFCTFSLFCLSELSLSYHQIRPTINSLCLIEGFVFVQKCIPPIKFCPWQLTRCLPPLHALYLSSLSISHQLLAGKISLCAQFLSRHLLVRRCDTVFAGLQFQFYLLKISL